MKRTNNFFKSSKDDSPFVRILVHLGIIIACIVSIFPIIRVFSISIRPGDRLLSTSLAIIPKDATVANYIEVLLHTDFFIWIRNSLLVTIITSIFGVVLAISAGYAFSRFRFPARRIGLIFLLATQMAPAAMLLLPLYIILSKFGFVDTYQGLIIAYSVTALPFSIWLLKGYFDTIPFDLEEAAMMDGCTQLGSFYRIVLPLSKPCIAIAGLFNFAAAWNDYIVARAIIHDPKLYTWTIGLTKFMGEGDVRWGLYAASAVLIALPITMLFLYSSKWLLTGLTLGALKE